MEWRFFISVTYLGESILSVEKKDNKGTFSNLSLNPVNNLNSNLKLGKNYVKTMISSR